MLTVLQVLVKIDGDSPGHSRLKEMVRKEGAAAVQKRLGAFVEELKAGKGA